MQQKGNQREKHPRPAFNARRAATRCLLTSRADF
nr:MAG TPA: hypothetical protein [Caudoviricetes sp.]